MKPTRILIASTAKTGNTWVEALFSTLYDLPIVEISGGWEGIGYRFEREAADALGPRWIAHQHFFVQPELIDWAGTGGVQIVTTIRHPAAVLVSYFHYVHNFASKLPIAPAMLTYIPHLTSDRSLTMQDVVPELTAYVREAFHEELACSINWMRSGASLVVRYEDLWSDPLTTLTALTEQLTPLPRERIEQAIEQQALPAMRRASGDRAAFFRRGGDGGWRDELPPAIIDLLRTWPPYPAQFAALGYTLDLDMEPPDAGSCPSATPLETTHFANGLPIAPLIFAAYMALPRARRQQWAEIADVTLNGSFFAWLSERAEDDPGDAVPIITNLAAYIYRLRADLRALFPDVFGRDRVPYALWFCRAASSEYDLDDALIAPIREHVRALLDCPEHATPYIAEIVATLFPHAVAGIYDLLAQKDTYIASLAETLAAREEELASIKPVLMARETELATAISLLAAREEEIAGLPI